MLIFALAYMGRNTACPARSSQFESVEMEKGGIKSQEKQETSLMDDPFSYFRFCSSDMNDSSSFVRLTMTPKKI